MSHYSTSRKPRLLIFAGLLTAILINLATLQSTHADKPERLSPQTIVTSDGRTYNAVGSMNAVERSFAGSDVPPSAYSPLLPTTEDRIGNPIIGNAPSSVIGSDGRTQYTTTTSFPRRAIAYLTVTWKDNSRGGCTGWLNGPRTVVTAGHCVYSQKAGKVGWAKSITACPGRNGSTYPYQCSTWHRLFTVNGWINGGNSNYDYGAIQLNSALGNTVGWFGFRYSTNDSSFQNLKVRITGYPGDKPSGTMWTMAGPIEIVQSRRFLYKIDTAPGQSGSPVYHVYNSVCCYSVAIHTNGGSSYNSGTRIVEGVFNNLKNWKNYPYP